MPQQNMLPAPLCRPTLLAIVRLQQTAKPRPIPHIPDSTLLVIGLVLFVLGWFLRSWASRHSMTDQVTDTAWEAVKKRDAGVIGREIKGKITEINQASSTLGKASKVAGYGVRHAMAQVAGLAGIAVLLIGLALAALGLFWR